MTQLPSYKLILASSSPARAQLLANLNLAFSKVSPNIDESRRQGEAPVQMVKRLSREKALAVADELSQAKENYLIIGSDQVAVYNNEVIGKPGNFADAKQQLMKFSNNSIEFLTGLCLYNSKTNSHNTVIETTVVKFHQLQEQEIIDYLEKEHPYNCAGSFRSEGLGILLIKEIISKDQSALIGLPLIKLNQLCKEIGVNLLETVD